MGGAYPSFRNVCGRDGRRNRCSSAKEFPVPKFCFFDFVGVHRGPSVDEAIRLQKTNAWTVPSENVPQIGTALEAMQV